MKKVKGKQPITPTAVATVSCRRLLIGGGVSVIIMVGLLLGFAAYANGYSDRVLPGVQLGSIAIGGMNRAELIEFLRPQVATWWLPDDIVFVEQIPKTSVGKFDKKVLREQFKEWHPKEQMWALLDES